MPKMTNPNALRPLSVQADEVDHYTGLGWSLVGGEPAKATEADKQAVAKTAKTAVTRKTTKKK